MFLYKTSWTESLHTKNNASTFIHKLDEVGMMQRVKYVKNERNSLRKSEKKKIWNTHQEQKWHHISAAQAWWEEGPLAWPALICDLWASADHTDSIELWQTNTKGIYQLKCGRWWDIPFYDQHFLYFLEGLLLMGVYRKSSFLLLHYVSFAMSERAALLRTWGFGCYQSPRRQSFLQG